MHKIFIVEDHRTILNIYIEIVENMLSLQMCGTARNSHEALERVPLADPDIVLMDVSLPGMNGIALLQKLKSIDSTLRIIVISGQDEKIYGRRALESGADGYIDKLNLLAIFPKAIEKVLEGHVFMSKTVRAALLETNPEFFKKIQEKKLDE